MDNVKRHIIRWFSLFLPWALFISCSNDDTPDSGKPAGSPGQPVSLHIVVGGDMTTRSIPATDEEVTGSIDENHIDIANGDYCILFFDIDNKFLSKFEPKDITLIPTVSDKRIYAVHGSLAAPLPSNFKVVVLANWGKDNYPETTAGVTTIEDVCSQRYDYEWNFVLSADSGKGIPMYGVKTCSDVSFTPNLLSSLGTIDMLRAIAKVEIICENENLKITSAKLNCVNSGGYCAPSGMYDKTENVSSVHIPTDISAKTQEKTYSGGTVKAVFYIPEYANENNEATIELDIQLSGNDTKQGTIYFKDYTQVGDAPFDIARNYVYRFIVSIKTDFEVKYTVCPWKEYTIEIPPFE